MMKASRQPSSAASSSYAKTKDDCCRQTTQDVDSPTEEIHPILKVQDPFLYYSNDRVRMRELRHKDQDVKDDSSDHGSSSGSLSAQEQSTATCVRKSRIAFELHPHLLLEDLDSPTAEIHPILKVQDPFLYYSNDRVRMRELRHQDEKDDSSDHGSSSGSLSAQKQKQLTTTCVRKSRITFELHPHLLLDGLMIELVDGDVFDFDVTLDASLVADEQDSGSVDDVIDHFGLMLMNKDEVQG